MKSVLVSLAGLCALAVSPLVMQKQPGTDAMGNDRRFARQQVETENYTDDGEALDGSVGTLPPYGQDPAEAIGTIAGSFNVGSDGSDGDLNCAWLGAYATCNRVLGTCSASDCSSSNPCTCTIDLRLATDGNWQTPGNGRGVYDPQAWAVVYKFGALHIPANVTVGFRNHPKRAPVVFLVQTSATISGALAVSAAFGVSGDIQEPGPGGFRGGHGFQQGNAASGGFGPGGGNYSNVPVARSAGSYATAGATGSSAVASLTYGYAGILPLLGGSGGSGHPTSVYDGAGGGGAILIAANDFISMTGSSAKIDADSKRYTSNLSGGSGGAIRLVARDVQIGSGATLTAVGDAAQLGGLGRIRIESVLAENVQVSTTPAHSWSQIVGAPQIWPPANHPAVRVAAIYVDGQPLGAGALIDPSADLFTSLQDVVFSTDSDIAVEVQAENVPLNWMMTVRVVPISGPTINVAAMLMSGDMTLSTWVSDPIVLPKGKAAVQVRAYDPNGMP